MELWSNCFYYTCSGSICVILTQSKCKGTEITSVWNEKRSSNIGENKLYELVKNLRCPFVLFIGNKRLIKKKEFEKYISENAEI